MDIRLSVIQFAKLAIDGNRLHVTTSAGEFDYVFSDTVVFGYAAPAIDLKAMDYTHGAVTYSEMVKYAELASGDTITVPEDIARAMVSDSPNTFRLEE